jgi:lysine 6-dehydrogenase
VSGARFRVAVLGGGRMGEAAAYDLARQPDVVRVIVVDRDRDRAALAAARAGEKGEARELDLRSTSDVGELFGAIDGAFSAASYGLNLALTRQAIAARIHFVDLGGNNAVVAAQLALDAEARAADSTVIPDCGLAPGLAGWLAVRLARQLERCDALRLRVGGLPPDRPPPLEYRLVFSVEGLINEYKEPCLVVRDGALASVEALTDVEPICFDAPFGTLECFHTSGGLSTLPRTLAGAVPNMEYKTIRWPGHAAKIRLLFALGLAGEEPIAIGDQRVVPRRVLEACLAQSLGDADDDVVLLRVEADGMAGGRPTRLVEQIIDRKDTATGFSAMARTTAFPAAIALLQALRGEVRSHGVRPGEEILDLDALHAALRERGIALERHEA